MVAWSLFGKQCPPGCSSWNLETEKVTFNLTNAILSRAEVKCGDLLIIIYRITHNTKTFQSRLRIENASRILTHPTRNTLIITPDVFCLLIMFTRQSSCFVHFSWFLLIMASQSNGLGFVVPWRGMHEVLLLLIVCVLQSMRGSIQGHAA